MQEQAILFDPTYGGLYHPPFPRTAAQFRSMYPMGTWLFNPWTGSRRHSDDVLSDPVGMLICVVGEPMMAAQ